MVCKLARSTSEVGMVTLFECFVGAYSEGDVVVVGIMPGVFAHVTRWCLSGAVCIWDGAVGVGYVRLLVVGVVTMLYTVVPKYFASCCNVSPFRPWKFWFYFLIFLIVWVIVVAISSDVSISVSVGMEQCCG